MGVMDEITGGKCGIPRENHDSLRFGRMTSKVWRKRSGKFRKGRIINIKRYLNPEKDGKFFRNTGKDPPPGRLCLSGRGSCDQGGGVTSFRRGADDEVRRLLLTFYHRGAWM